MEMKHFPTINLEATGKHIAQLRKERGLSVKDMQNYFGFDAPQAIYKWQNGTALPTVDNLLALSVLLEVSIDSILVTTPSNITMLTDREPEGSVFLRKNACWMTIKKTTSGIFRRLSVFSTDYLTQMAGLPQTT